MPYGQCSTVTLDVEQMFVWVEMPDVRVAAEIFQTQNKKELVIQNFSTTD